MLLSYFSMVECIDLADVASVHLEASDGDGIFDFAPTLRSTLHAVRYYSEVFCGCLVIKFTCLGHLVV